MHHTNRSRRGFTLIELLAVIAIIAILVALLSGAIQRVRNNQMVHASEDVVSKLQEGIDNQVKGINESVVKERRDRTATFAAFATYCGDDDRAAALLTYCRVRQNFPQSPADLAGFTVAGVSFVPSQVFTPLASVTGNVDQVSAAFLYMALSQRTLQGNTFESDAATSGAQIDIVLNGVNCRIYKDPWGNPIGYRFVSESQIPELQFPPYAKQGAIARDPFDPPGNGTSYPSGKLAGWTSPNSGIAQNALGLTPAGLGFGFDGKNKAIVVYGWGSQLVSSPISLTATTTILGYRLRSIGQKGSK